LWAICFLLILLVSAHPVKSIGFWLVVFGWHRICCVGR
jgi:hypothetical protein